MDKEFVLNENLKIKEVDSSLWMVCKKNDIGWSPSANISILKYSETYEFRFSFNSYSGYFDTADELNSAFENTYLISLSQECIDYLDSRMMVCKMI